MQLARMAGLVIILSLIHPIGLRGQDPKPETVRDFEAYVKAVRDKTFPGPEHSF